VNTVDTFELEAENRAANLPDLLVSAENLASTVLSGVHGRRRAGQGDDFWQYRPLATGDALRDIDWRRSARGDQTYIRQRELQLAQSVGIWVDSSATLRFASQKSLPTKAQRARVLGLAVGIVMLRSGERVGLAHKSLPPRRSPLQRQALAEAIALDVDLEFEMPDIKVLPAYSRAVFLSDFLAPIDILQSAIGDAANKGIKGVLMQVLDPAEEDFPFRGRTIFQSVFGSMKHETQKASDLRDRYLDRLAERRDALSQLARQVGWHFVQHRTDNSALSALLWMYQAIEGHKR
jgi:uncharacterized protein (DUF58 family)